MTCYIIRLSLRSHLFVIYFTYCFTLCSVCLLTNESSCITGVTCDHGCYTLAFTLRSEFWPWLWSPWPWPWLWARNFSLVARCDFLQRLSVNFSAEDSKPFYNKWFLGVEMKSGDRQTSVGSFRWTITAPANDVTTWTWSWSYSQHFWHWTALALQFKALSLLCLTLTLTSWPRTALALQFKALSLLCLTFTLWFSLLYALSKKTAVLFTFM